MKYRVGDVFRYKLKPGDPDKLTVIHSYITGEGKEEYNLQSNRDTNPYNGIFLSTIDTSLVLIESQDTDNQI